jgi:ATP/maltotriose-dependent transcriptional regulator MalT
MRTGDFGRAQDVLDEAALAAAESGDRRLELRTRIEQEFCRSFTDPEGSALDDSSVAEATIPLLEELGDDAGLAKAWWLKSEPDVNACRWGARAEALERALEHARRAGDRAEVATMTFLHTQALYCGPTPVPEATEQCRRYLHEYPDDRLLEASVTAVLAGLRAMEGDFDEARSMFARARDVHEELGRRLRLATVGSILGAEIEQLAGRPEDAVSILRSAYGTVHEMGAMSATATMAGFFADALAVEGQNAEAAEISRFAEEHAPESDVVTQVLWRTARARAAGDGEAIAREAVAIASTTDYPELRARAALCLADVIGAGDEHASLYAEARRVYEAKGNVAAAARLPAQSPAPS